MEDNKVISLSGARGKEKKEETKDEGNKDKALYCSFCGRPNTQVIKMVQGPGVNICSECTMICVQYLILEGSILSSDAQKVLDTFWNNSTKK